MPSFYLEEVAIAREVWENKIGMRRVLGGASNQNSVASFRCFLLLKNF